MSAFLAAVGLLAVAAALPPPAAGKESSQSCFLLFELGVGEVRREPSKGCRTRVSPASTFKIAHALAALDAGVVESADSVLPYDGTDVPFLLWKRDHTLASAIHFSVVWYFQRIAERLGAQREASYLARLDYGNRDVSSGLTTFWLGGSLRISPEEEERFLVRLYEDDLPVSARVMETVREMLREPPGVISNASGERAFGGTWPEGTSLSAKTGNAQDSDGRYSRWIVGHVARGDRAWVFVSSVAGKDVAGSAALDLAERALHEEGLLGAPSSSH